MLHHISFGVRELELSGAFYDAALGALGFRRVFEDETAVGYGLEQGKDLFCIKLRPTAAAPGPGFHLAFSAPSRSAVEAFHRDALRVGGRDNGPPGLRRLMPDHAEEIMQGFGQQYFEEGVAVGEARGEARGKAQGKAEGEAQALARLLERRFGTVPAGVRARIFAAELGCIEMWFDRAIEVTDLDSVFEAD